MNIKNQKLFFISLIGIVVVSIVLLTSYAYQTLEVNKKNGSNDDLTVNAGVLDVSFRVSNRINNTNTKFYDTYKLSDYSEFVIDNTKSSQDASYMISIVDMEYSNVLKTSDFKYTIYSVSNDEIIDEGDFSSLSGNTIELSQYRTIKKNSTEIVRLYLWLKETNENQNGLMNSKFKGVIEIVSRFDNEVNFQSGTLAYSILNNAKNSSDATRTIYRKNPLTKPAEEISSTDEKVLSVTTDDYGKSYYFRGNVIDNYVDFAGMCWRIVRIMGDGSIKLILEDQDSTCATSNGNWNIPTKTGGTTTKGNYGYDEYVINSLTATDGTKNSSILYIMNYLNGKTSKTLSMAYAFEQFQNGSLSNYLSYLKKGDWCLNNKAYAIENNNSTALTNTEISDKQIKGTSFYYDSYVRLFSKTTKELTLKCNGTNMSEFADSTDMYVGALTADEIVYAGGKVYTNNLYYYLINDYQKSNNLYFWSLSSGQFIKYYADALGVGINEGVVNASIHNVYNFSFRPVITLSSGAGITGGDGTKTNAYVVG